MYRLVVGVLCILCSVYCVCVVSGEKGDVESKRVKIHRHLAQLRWL
jgi:hypothetical protein